MEEITRTGDNIWIIKDGLHIMLVSKETNQRQCSDCENDATYAIRAEGKVIYSCNDCVGPLRIKQLENTK